MKLVFTLVVLNHSYKADRSKVCYEKIVFIFLEFVFLINKCGKISNSIRQGTKTVFIQNNVLIWFQKSKWKTNIGTFAAIQV